MKIEFFEKLIDDTKKRIMNAIGRCVISAIDDTKKMQEIKGTFFAGEERAAMERFQNYGFTGVPGSGSEAIAVFVSGNREHGIVIALDDKRYRLKSLKEWDSAIYHKEGHFIKLTENGEAHFDLTKFKIENSSYDFVTVLSDLLQALIDARVATSGGPQPLLNPGDPFPTIKTRLDSFKV